MSVKKSARNLGQTTKNTNRSTKSSLQANKGLKDVNKVIKVEKKSTTKVSKRNIDEELRAEYLSLAKLKEGSEMKGQGLTDINYMNDSNALRVSDSYNKAPLNPKVDNKKKTTALSQAEKYAREAEEELESRVPRDQPVKKVEKKEAQKYEDFMGPSQFFNPDNRDYNTGSAYQMKDETGAEMGFVNFEMDIDDSSDED